MLHLILSLLNCIATYYSFKLPRRRSGYARTVLILEGCAPIPNVLEEKYVCLLLHLFLKDSYLVSFTISLRKY